jgi:hypothetical protein
MTKTTNTKRSTSFFRRLFGNSKENNQANSNPEADKNEAPSSGVAASASISSFKEVSGSVSFVILGNNTEGGIVANRVCSLRPSLLTLVPLLSTGTRPLILAPIPPSPSLNPSR